MKNKQKEINTSIESSQITLEDKALESVSGGLFKSPNKICKRFECKYCYERGFKYVGESPLDRAPTYHNCNGETATSSCSRCKHNDSGPFCKAWGTFA